VTMTLNSASYSLSWSGQGSSGDFTAGIGWNPGSNHSVTYSGSYSNAGGGSFGIYGWSENPLIEYYIADNWGSTGGPGQGTLKGTVVTDGATYNIYEHQQVNQPSIVASSSTFNQYISVRQSSRTSGTITISNHFNAWKALGLNLGTLNYQILLTEGWSGSGSSSVSSLSTAPAPAPTSSTPPPSNPPPPPPPPPQTSSGSCVLYGTGSSLSSPFVDYSYGGTSPILVVTPPFPLLLHGMPGISVALLRPPASLSLPLLF